MVRSRPYNLKKETKLFIKIPTKSDDQSKRTENHHNSVKRGLEMLAVPPAQKIRAQHVERDQCTQRST